MSEPLVNETEGNLAWVVAKAISPRYWDLCWLDDRGLSPDEIEVLRAGAHKQALAAIACIRTRIGWLLGQ